MKNLVEFAEEVISNSFDQFGVNLKDAGWTVSVRKMSGYGLCYWSKKLVFNKHLHKASDEDIILVILHEVAHAIDVELRGYSNHDKTWRSICRSIGGDGKRQADFYVDLETKWTLQCTSCLKKWSKTRKPKREKSCHVCCNHYNPEFKLKLIQNY